MRGRIEDHTEGITLAYDHVIQADEWMWIAQARDEYTKKRFAALGKRPEQAVKRLVAKMFRAWEDLPHDG
jgi:hypothetical protein